MSQGTIGYKSKLAWGDGGAPEVFTEVAEQVTCEPADPQFDEALGRIIERSGLERP